MLAAVYMDRYLAAEPLHALTVHRLLLTALLLGAKYLDDDYYSNRFYAQIGGISLRELNALERNFVVKIGWRLHVSPEDYQRCLATVFAATDSWLPATRPAVLDEAGAREAEPRARGAAGAVGSGDAAREAVRTAERSGETPSAPKRGQAAASEPSTLKRSKEDARSWGPELAAPTPGAAETRVHRGPHRRERPTDAHGLQLRRPLVRSKLGVKRASGLSRGGVTLSGFSAVSWQRWQCPWH